MRKYLVLLCCLFFIAAKSDAQYVNILDSNFRDYLIYYYPSCFNSNKQLDTVQAANLNEESLDISGVYGARNIDGIQYFKKTKMLNISISDIDSINFLPNNLRSLKLSNLDSLSFISYLPSTLDSLDIWEMGVPPLLVLPSNLTYLSINYTGLSKLPYLPNSIETIWLGGNLIDTIYNLPLNLKYFYAYNNPLKKIFYLPNQLIDFESSGDSLSALPTLPTTLKYLGCRDNYVISQLPTLPNNLLALYVDQTSLTSLPTLPNSLIDLNISFNHLTNVPTLPQRLRKLDYSVSKGFNFSSLPDSLRELNCSSNQLTWLPPLPKMLSNLRCAYNELTFLPPLNNLDSLSYIDCQSNKLYSLPQLPPNVSMMFCGHNNLTYFPTIPHSMRQLFLDANNLTCLPYLPDSITMLSFDTNKIKCLTNIPNGLMLDYHIICNPINNPNHCKSFPAVQSFAYTDKNTNGVFGINEYPKNKIKITLSNNNYAYTNINGKAEIYADSLGTYTITATAPNFYNVVPASYTHNFTSYDTLVIDTFALQPTVLKDSISIKLTPTNWAARAGRSYPYLVSYENVGTTVLSTPTIHFNYDNSLLVYDSSSVGSVTNNGNNLSLNIGNIVPGQTSSFIAYFTVKIIAALGSNVTSVASINAGSINATDSVTTIVRGSYDPNDKQATPNLTPQQVADGDYINYTIRFQNTGTDTAFNVVIADTLDSKLIASQMQMVGSSHNCKTTVKDNVIFFEFLNIYLPDSNVNKTGSNGFVSFKIKPINTVTNGTIIPNNAAIYFDYNSPIITNTAKTIIQNSLPLTLLSFNAIAKEDNNVMVYWNTANEVNTSHFVIEQSVDGRAFKPVVEIAAKGIGSNSYFYSITKGNIVYLRLKMVDKNGTYTYSNIIKLAEDKSNGFDIVNNPTKGVLNVNVYSISLNNTTAKIVNAQGQIVKTFMLKHNLQTIDITALQRGVYYLQTTLGAKKFVVE